MHPHAKRFREQIAAGRPMLGTFLVEFSGAAAVHLLADAGFDFVMIDCEHGHFDPREMEATIEAGWQAGVCMLLRVPNHDRAIITRGLDAGAAGIVVPAIDRLEQVHEIVRACKYRPIGKRGVHLFRGHTRHRPVQPDEYMAGANRDTLNMIQIELAAAVELADEIAAIDGVDGLYVGRGDLSVDLGVAGKWDSPVVMSAVERVIAACQKHNKIAACHTDFVDDMADLHAKGVQMIGYFCDVGLFARAAKNVGEQVNEVLPQRSE